VSSDLWLRAALRSAARTLTPAAVGDLFFSLKGGAFAETGAAELSPEAQTAFQKGMLAAEQGAMELALKYFKEVHKSSPFYPPVLFNLGVTLSKSGKELPAIAWLHAYLASGAAPEEKKAVEAELLKLEVATEAKAVDIMKQAIELTGALPEGDVTYANPRKEALQHVYWSYVRTGNVEEAVQFGKDRGIITSDATQDTLMNLVILVGEYADRGDIEKAEGVTARITADPYQMEAWLKLSKHYAKVGDFKKLEMSRPKLKGQVPKNDLRDLVTALVEGDQMNLAKSYMELGDAEGLAGIIFDMSLKKRENEVRELLPKAEKLISGNDLNQLTEVANAAVTLKDYAMLKRLIPRLEEGNKIYSTPGIFTAHLAGYYSQLKEYKKADQIFATIPPDNPGDWAGRNKSFAANQIIKAAAAQGDFKRFQNYLPHSRSGFMPSELGEAFAKFAWHEMSEGEEKDAEKILAACPDGGSLEGWKVDDPNLHRDTMYKALAIKAAQAGNFAKSYEYAGKVFAPYWKAVAFSGLFDELVKKENLAEAQALFEKEAESFRQGKDTAFIYRNMLLSLAELLIKKNEPQAAQEKFDKALRVTLELNELEYLADQLIELAEKLPLTDRVQELNQLKKVNAWMVLATKLESDTTFNPEQIYQDAKAKPPGEVPEALARLAENYWARLREIDFLKRTQG
jgi:hypothetical protein